jgi:hypothetical protein
MATNHEVAQGEHLSTIASEYGFHDYTIIWDHPNNAQLKAQRQNPNILLPGDSVYIPDKEQKQEQGATSARHTFQVNQPKLKLRLVLEDIYEQPIANASCILSVGQQQFQLTSDAQGKIEQEIPPHATNCTLVIQGNQTPYQGQTLTIKVGHLDPIDSLSGQRARLNNLGYMAGTSDDPQDPQFLSAVEQFQCDQKIAVDGDIGPATQATLKTAHGC